MPKNKEQDSGTAECYSPTDFEVQYRNLAEQAFVGVYVVEDKKFIYANPRMAEIFGYTLDEFVGKLGPVNVIHPDDYAHIYEKSQKRLIGEIKTDYYQFRGVKKDGGIIYVEIYGSRFQHRGKPAVTGVLSDITERVNAEEDLKRELQHEKDLSEQAFVGVYAVQNGKFVYANPRMAEIFGYTVNEFIGKLGPVNVIHPEDFLHIHIKGNKRLNGEIETDYYKFRGIKKMVRSFMSRYTGHGYSSLGNQQSLAY